MQSGTGGAPLQDKPRWAERVIVPVLAVASLATIVWCATILGAGLWLLHRMAL
jgi:hypothetical protein